MSAAAKTDGSEADAAEEEAEEAEISRGAGDCDRVRTTSAQLSLRAKLGTTVEEEEEDVAVVALLLLSALDCRDTEGCREPAREFACECDLERDVERDLPRLLSRCLFCLTVTNPSSSWNS